MKITLIAIVIFLFSLVGNANSINIRLRVTAPDGLLLWVGGQGQEQDLQADQEGGALSQDFLILGVKQGILQVGNVDSIRYIYVYYSSPYQF